MSLASYLCFTEHTSYIMMNGLFVDLNILKNCGKAELP